MTNTNQYDYIIIGAGSAGCVLANRLVNAGAQVALLEAGPSNHAIDYRLHMPAALSHILANDTYNWYYSSQPEPGLNNRVLYCPRGRVLGGSSSINGMIYVRGNPSDFDRWAQLTGYESWRYEHCLPYFKKAENIPLTVAHIEDDVRGHNGPLNLSRGKLDNPLFHAFLAACQEAGYPIIEDLNGKTQEGFGPFDRTIFKGKRWSTADAYLNPVRQSGNLTLLTNTRVVRILTEGARVTGIECLQKGQIKHLAAKEVILCGGAINSPQLLMLSGIGDPAHLEKVGVAAKHSLPGVGANLQDHLEIYVQQACREPVSIAPALKWYNQVWIGMQWYLSHTGPGATNHFEAGGFIKSNSSTPYPDIQFHFLPVATTYDGRNRHKGHGYQVHIGPMKPTSRGSVRLASADPRHNPLITFNYHTTEADRKVMRSAIEKARHILSQQALSRYREHEIQPGDDVKSEADIEAFVRAHAESAYHPSCTCAMGESEESVVNEQGQVHGMENLRVVDASIMPEITNGNLNAPVIMMAEKIAATMLS